jgi:hypothetical protein
VRDASSTWQPLRGVIEACIALSGAWWLWPSGIMDRHLGDLTLSTLLCAGGSALLWLAGLVGMIATLAG